MVPAPDPQKVAPLELDLALLGLLVEQVRARLLAPKPDDPLLLSRFGWAVLDHLELRPTDVTPTGASQTMVRQVYEEVGRRYLNVALPAIDDLPRLDAKHVAEYIAAIDPNRPDPGRLSAAFGAARMALFGHDRRLVYRSIGYRGRWGNPLADFLIETVVRPVTAMAAGVPLRDL